MTIREKTILVNRLKTDLARDIVKMESVINYNKQIIKEKLDKVNADMKQWDIDDIEDKIQKYLSSICECVSEIIELRTELENLTD